MPAAVPLQEAPTAPVSPPVPAPVIEVIDVCKTFDGRNVLDGVNLTVRRGETLVIMGASGCGKSTLLRCLIGAHSVDRGSVKLFGKDISNLKQRDLDSVRKRYGILFQSGALFSSMTVGENVALPLKEHTKLGSDMIDLMVKVKLELVGLREAEDRLPSEISGGMAKRAGLARAIALDPELLFYDEPTSGLDPIMTGIIDSLIIDLARTMSVTSVVVTHDLQSAFRVADRMVVLNNGRIVMQGLPNEIRASMDPFVRRFIHGPVESKTVMIPRGGLDRPGTPRDPGAFIPPPTGAHLVSSGIRRAIQTPLPQLPSLASSEPPITTTPLNPEPILQPTIKAEASPAATRIEPVDPLLLEQTASENASEKAPEKVAESKVSDTISADKQATGNPVQFPTDIREEVDAIDDVATVYPGASRPPKSKSEIFIKRRVSMADLHRERIELQRAQETAIIRPQTAMPLTFAPDETVSVPIYESNSDNRMDLFSPSASSAAMAAIAAGVPAAPGSSGVLLPLPPLPPASEVSGNTANKSKAGKSTAKHPAVTGPATPETPEIKPAAQEASVRKPSSADKTAFDLPAIELFTKFSSDTDANATASPPAKDPAPITEPTAPPKKPEPGKDSNPNVTVIGAYGTVIIHPEIKPKGTE